MAFRGAFVSVVTVFGPCRWWCLRQIDIDIGSITARTCISTAQTYYQRSRSNRSLFFSQVQAGTCITVPRTNPSRSADDEASLSPRATTHDECPQRRSSDRAHTALLITRRRCNVAKRASAPAPPPALVRRRRSCVLRFAARLQHVFSAAVAGGVALAASRAGADWAPLRKER